MAWGWAAWGSRHTDCRDSRLGTHIRPPEALVVLAGLKGYRKDSVPQDTPSLLAFCWHNSHGLSLPRKSLVAGGARGPQLGGDPVSAGLLGAGLILCMGGGQVNKQGIAGGDHGAEAALFGHGVHMPGATVGDWIRATAQGGGRHFSPAT